MKISYQDKKKLLGKYISENETRQIFLEADLAIHIRAAQYK